MPSPRQCRKGEKKKKKKIQKKKKKKDALSATPATKLRQHLSINQNEKKKKKEAGTKKKVRRKGSKMLRPTNKHTYTRIQQK